MPNKFDENGFYTRDYIMGPWGDKYEQGISDWCDGLKTRLVEKYRKGKAEHGELDAGKPLNCQKEILNEVLDILNYHLIDRVQKNSVAK